MMGMGILRGSDDGHDDGDENGDANFDDEDDNEDGRVYTTSAMEITMDMAAMIQ